MHGKQTLMSHCVGVQHKNVVSPGVLELLVVSLHSLTLVKKFFTPIVQEPSTYNPAGSVRILAVDCGIKNNQIRCLANRGACVKVVPWNYNFNEEGLCHV